MTTFTHTVKSYKTINTILMVLMQFVENLEQFFINFSGETKIYLDFCFKASIFALAKTHFSDLNNEPQYLHIFCSTFRNSSFSLSSKPIEIQIFHSNFEYQDSGNYYFSKIVRY